MLSRIASVPFFVLLMAIGTGLMLVPALYARESGDTAGMLGFLIGAALSGMLTILVGLALRGQPPRHPLRGPLIVLFAAYGLLPLMFALPFVLALPGTRPFDAWFEMVSAMTTTGATLWPGQGTLTPTLHLWRGLVGWAGGFLAWVMAFAILAPMNLGGFEVGSDTAAAQFRNPIARVRDPSERLARHAQRLLPVYAGLTAVLWLGLMLAGDGATAAAVHAMGTISTSGISAVGGLAGGGSDLGAGIAGEMLILVFLVFAMSHVCFAPSDNSSEGRWRDPELRLGVGIVVLAAAAMLLFHAGAAETGTAAQFLSSAWGVLFTAASFLTTTGYESRGWAHATLWSGLPAPGLVLLGLALIGGGVATTAGGVKLLRIYALIRHGQREVERLIHPASVGGHGAAARRIRREGAVIAWTFFMLYALSIVVVMLALALVGTGDGTEKDFGEALVFTIAAITTTGPLVQAATPAALSFADLPDAARATLAAAMVLGRLETLALIALLNPDFWRR